jgi:dihydroneopterin aldolase
MTDLITLKGLRGFGYHGVLDHERRDGQEFIVDVEVTTDFSVAAKTDQLDATLNYALIADLVFAKITGPAFNLIESLAGSIGDQILQMPNVISVEVTVHKPFAPIEVEFDDVSVTRRLP